MPSVRANGPGSGSGIDSAGTVVRSVLPVSHDAQLAAEGATASVHRRGREAAEDDAGREQRVTRDEEDAGEQADERDGTTDCPVVGRPIQSVRIEWSSHI
jgi:hypothetical protein